MSNSSRSIFNSQTLSRLRRKLTRWFDRHGRPLPWRLTRDPYSIWISEIMLQQTTVKAVVPYFERFIDRFPTLHELAAASEEEVLKLWEGLGYYSRGRNLRRAAIVLCQKHGGRFPEDVTELQQLPGIGRYTAGAIASFAFDQPAPILEANTQRVYCRLLGFTENPHDTAGQRTLWGFAEELQPARGAGKLNQALMELGSQVCTPVDPKCTECPVQDCCRAAALGVQQRIPVPKPRPDVTPIVEGAVAIRHRGRVLVLRRLIDERWAGLWDFPRFELPQVPHREKLGVRKLDDARRQLQRRLHAECNCEVNMQHLICEIRHSVTRYRIRLLCFAAEASSRISLRGREFAWVTANELTDLPLSMTGRRLADALLASSPEKSLF